MRSVPAMIVLVMAEWTCGCSHRTTSHSTVVSPATPVRKPAVYATMDRQVRNAVDAGEGDLQVQSLQKRLAAQPNELKTRLELAGIYERSGHAELALEHYRTARRANPDSPELLLREAGALSRLDLDSAAVEELTQFVEAHPKVDNVVLTRLAILLDKRSESVRAEAYLRRAVSAAPGDAHLHNNLGYNLLLQKRYAEAGLEFEAALRIDPSNQVSRNNLALSLALNPNPDRAGALRHWTTASTVAAAHNNLAAAWIEQRRYREAREELGIALGAKPDFGAALRNLDLVSKLDGGAPSVQTQHSQSAWSRFLSALKSALIVARETTPQPGHDARRVASER